MLLSRRIPGVQRTLRSMRIMRGTLSAFVCAALLCRPAAAIVGDAELADWGIVRPALMIAGPRGSVCSAAIIGRDLLLTAAHCVTAKSDIECVDASSRAHIGTTDQSCVMAGRFVVTGPGSTWRGAKAIVLHPEYDHSQKRGPDLALVKLDGPLAANLTPAMLATRPVQRGDRLTIVGYGLNDSGKLDRKARMATFTVDRSLRLIDPAPLGQEPKLGARGGDSGAPVFAMRLGSPLLVAIVTGREGTGIRTVIEPIAAHREWIWSTAQQLGSQLGP